MNLTKEFVTACMDRAKSSFSSNEFQQSLNIFTAVYQKLLTKTESDLFQKSETPESQEFFLYTLAKSLTGVNICNIRLGQLDKALAAGNEVTSRFPNYAKGHSVLAATLKELKRFAEAGVSFRDAATVSDRRDADQPETYRELAKQMDMLNINSNNNNNGNLSTNVTMTTTNNINEQVLHQETWYVEKFKNEASDAAVKGDFKSAAELFLKSIKHERKRVEDILSTPLPMTPNSNNNNNVVLSAEQREKQEYLNNNPIPTLAILLVNRANMLCRSVANPTTGSPLIVEANNNSYDSNSTMNSGKITLMLALEDVQEALKVSRNCYARAHARQISIFIQLGKLRSAREHFDMANALFINSSANSSTSSSSSSLTAQCGGVPPPKSPPRTQPSSSSSNTESNNNAVNMVTSLLSNKMLEDARQIMLKSGQELVAAETKAKEKIVAAEQELERQKREVEQAQNARFEIGDMVGADNMKRRKTENENATSTATVAMAKIVGAFSGGAGRSEYCKFCSTQGHSQQNCPLKKSFQQ